ncbi:glycosyltransferase family 2 protein [Microbulbifer hydrolyticus]|uniref:Glycosyltransferase n=1 Tax=Microbulbifer hydrolyticus TaxID=48074 RepID=A0A6P1TFY1_9GAMM|nr:glycosyltransferase family A protein [Microbulbifer hydrolyticus]MBB5211837.1 glycosyltransferase involved in cell wall biosynthesis [Microbulbifer hydrolyticus]QHQ40576.1 glycosyltransferase [Microbulbifer hydrolyticus]
MADEKDRKSGAIQNTCIGFVLIGRNEGERLRNCVDSIVEQLLLINRDKKQGPDLSGTSDVFPIVYVDSGSTDGSVTYATSAGCTVLELDLREPFTAARARNEGLKLLINKFPQVELIQFIDGDCSLQPGWLGKATAFLAVNPKVAIVCGRRREVYPQKSIYNALCDMEWDTPVGEAKACGGDFLVRKEAILSVKGFNPAMIAGEEPEMCLRLRKRKWAIWRIHEEMTLHDADMTSFRQFWLRNARAGFAYAERWLMHSTRIRPYCKRELLSICFWGGFLPISIVLFMATMPVLGFALALAYPLMTIRIFLRRMKMRSSVRKSLIFSGLTQIGKFPQFFGVLKFTAGTLSGKSTPIIEYK